MDSGCRLSGSLEHHWTRGSTITFRWWHCLFNWCGYIWHWQKEKVFPFDIPFLRINRRSYDVYICVLLCFIKKPPQSRWFFFIVISNYFANLSAVAMATPIIFPKPNCLSSAVAFLSFLMKWSVTVNKHKAFLLSLAALQ